MSEKSTRGNNGKKEPQLTLKEKREIKRGRAEAETVKPRKGRG